MQTGFRADIQGLRALAVLVVIVFHAGLPLRGGFVGVDIFFVISGFVITGMLMREWDRTGSISMMAFYLRRAKRLTPALALVVGVTAIASSLLLSPFAQQQQAAQTGLGALALVANWVIAMQSGDYFGPGAETNPLLHTWSLSVEEQFYVFFPISLLVAWRIGRRFGRAHLAALLLVCLIGMTSLAMIRGPSVGIPGDSWIIGYYSPFVRAWEFAAGAALSLVARHLPLNKPLALVTGASGLLLLGVSVTMISAETLFPGKWTLVPVLGATLCIAAGSLHPDNLVSRVLSLRQAVRVGDWSYSLYLWHWPLIVIALALFPLSPWAAPVAALFSLAPAVMSYVWVEARFRDMSTRPSKRLIVSVTAVTIGAATLAATSWVVAIQIWTPAYESGALKVGDWGAEVGAEARIGAAQTGMVCEREELARYVGDNGACRQSKQGESLDVVLLGDSHAEHLFAGVVRALPRQNVAIMSFRAPPMFGSRAGLDLALEAILSSDPRPTVIVSRYWTRGPLDQEDQFQPLDYAVQRLTAAGVEVILVDDVPDFPFPVTTCSYRLAPIIGTAVCSQPKDRVDGARDVYVADLGRIAADHPGTRVVEIGATLCDESRCSMLSGGELAYSDPDHLNAVGSRVFASRLVEAAGLN